MSILSSFLKTVLIKVLGNERFQRVLERNVDRFQFLMGIGAGTETVSSGEQAIFDSLRRRCSAPYCIFDVGSNKGQFLQLILASIATDHFSIHCFEPGVETFRILAQSCKEDKRIRLNNLGIGKEEGEADLITTRSVQDSRLSQEETWITLISTLASRRRYRLPQLIATVERTGSIVFIC